MLIGLDQITEIIETVLWTGALDYGIPISSFVIGPAGAGKSRLLTAFSGETIHRSDDLTSSGVLELMERDKENKIKHILISDLNAILSHKSSTTNLTIGNLLSLMSEGIVRVDDGRRNKEVPHKPIGLIVGLTPEMYELYFERWEATGFRRRFLPIFYTYKASTIVKIQRAIETGKIRMQQENGRVIHLKRVFKPLQWSIEHQRMLAGFTDRLTANLAWKPTIKAHRGRKATVNAEVGKIPLPFTPEQIIQALAEAHAARSASKKIRNKDVEFASGIVDFTSYNAPMPL